MSLKTDYPYNEADFAEHDGHLEELTVTITLCEYRNLVAENTRVFAINDRLEDELAKAREENKALKDKCTEIQTELTVRMAERNDLRQALERLQNG